MRLESTQQRQNEDKPGMLASVVNVAKLLNIQALSWGGHPKGLMQSLSSSRSQAKPGKMQMSRMDGVKACFYFVELIIASIPFTGLPTPG